MAELNLQAWSPESESTPLPTLVHVKRLDSGAMDLCVVDESGVCRDCSNILVLTTRGTLRLRKGLNPDLGFQLDKQGRIKVEP